MKRVWGWRRWIDSGKQELWIERLGAIGCTTWTLTEKINRVRILLAVHSTERTEAVSLQRHFGGQIREVKESEWIRKGPTPPTRIGRRLEVVHEKARGRETVPRLHIPHGIAFGSGDHGTTHMLLQALALQKDWSGATVLDLGTGSGVLALAARKFGAKKIMATDFDADAVRTARQNEMLNFSKPLIIWRCADVKLWRAAIRYDLVVANLFSGILEEAAPQIAGSLAKEGQLWVSGVLRSQQKSVVAAYRKQGLELSRSTNRGKWVMLQFCR